MLVSGAVAAATWTLTDPGEYGWYVRTSDPHGAVNESVVNRLTVRGDDGGSDGGGGSDDGGSGGDGSGSGSGSGEDGAGSRPGMPETGASGVLTGLLLAALAVGLGLTLRELARRRAARG